mmetsp:Transcript_1653/g.4090  ORF Transcript_1653/g.4090 Transcript_1653/m.4090 type:complete len:208 (-) Transcript_1653:455-1078(-)
MPGPPCVDDADGVAEPSTFGLSAPRPTWVDAAGGVAEPFFFGLATTGIKVIRNSIGRMCRSTGAAVDSPVATLLRCFNLAATSFRCCTSLGWSSGCAGNAASMADAKALLHMMYFLMAFGAAPARSCLTACISAATAAEARRTHSSADAMALAGAAAPIPSPVVSTIPSVGKATVSARTGPRAVSASSGHSSTWAAGTAPKGSSATN